MTYFASHTSSSAELHAIERRFQLASPLQAEPIPHLVVNDLFDPDISEGVLSWFENDAVWEKSTSHFYDQLSCRNLQEMPYPVRQVLSRPILDVFCNHLSQAFGITLAANRYYVAAHKLLPGMGIGLHTDVPTGGTETHRLLVTFTRDFEDDHGGHLLLFAKDDPQSLSRIFRPLLASAISFPLGENSYHAVNDVTGGERYSLVYSFWEEGSPFESDATSHLRAASQRIPSERLGAYAQATVEYLINCGAAEIPHSHRTLIDHLCGVAGLLEYWNCDESVCLIGLCHSVYGTQGFEKQMLDDSQREYLAAIVGERVERLAFAFGRVNRAELYSSLPNPDNVELQRFDDGPTITLNARDRRDLLAVIWANSIEQIYYEPVLDSDFKDMQAGLAAISPYLPEAAVVDLKQRLQIS